MTGAILKYDEARQLLADAVAIDEVASIRNKAEALRIYARQAKDRQGEIDFAQIRFRAERRLGEFISGQKEGVGLAKGGKPYQDATPSDEEEVERTPTLKEVGIDHKLSSKAQRLAAMDVADFEASLARHAEEMRSGAGRVAMDLHRLDAEERGRAHRRDLARTLSDRSAELPSGRVFPAAYIDPPWKRDGGIGNRAYENHYPTMSWPDILAYLRDARQSLLPDSWAFIWIPRAHLLALVEIELEVTVSLTGEVVPSRVEVPLGWAVGHALGMDSYSTCFVWTKTDEDHPDASGSGLIAWDQDELLLLFKRGQGLPKPSGSEKFGSNHRERPREHSRKPDFYRHMIATMTGGLPVLEMFARVDAEHPLPPGWEACGNQAIDDSDGGGETQTREVTGLQPAADQHVLHSRAGVAHGPSDLSPAFPPTEFADLRKLENSQPLDTDRLASYVTRGLVTNALGPWQLTRAGEIRLDVVQRERLERIATCKKHLDRASFDDWSDLSAIAGGEHVNSSVVRNLVGIDLVVCTDDDVFLTDAGRSRLAELEAIVDGAQPKQIDLEELLTEPVDLPLFLSSKEPAE